MAALQTLVGRVCPKLSSCPHDKPHPTWMVSELHLLIYFDSAYNLTKTPVKMTNRDLSPIASQNLYPLDVLVKVMDDLGRQGLFSVFISTECKLRPMSTPALEMARSNALCPSRFRILHAPITETPFDCFGSSRIDPKRIEASNLCNIVFMSCFGRPL